MAQPRASKAAAFPNDGKLLPASASLSQSVPSNSSNTASAVASLPPQHTDCSSSIFNFSQMPSALGERASRRARGTKDLALMDPACWPWPGVRIVIVCGGNGNFRAIRFYIIRFAKENNKVSVSCFTCVVVPLIPLVLFVIMPFKGALGNDFPLLFLSFSVSGNFVEWSVPLQYYCAVNRAHGRDSPSPTMPTVQSDPAVIGPGSLQVAAIARENQFHFQWVTLCPLSGPSLCFQTRSSDFFFCVSVPWDAQHGHEDDGVVRMRGKYNALGRMLSFRFHALTITYDSEISNGET